MLQFIVHNKLLNLTTSIWKRWGKYSFLALSSSNFLQSLHSLTSETQTSDFADELVNFPRYLEVTYRESVLDRKQMNFRVVSQYAIETSAAENAVLYKSCGTNITHRGMEKVTWKQTIK